MIEKLIIERELHYLKSIVADELIEAKKREYKQSLPANLNDDKISFLAEVTSLANTIGGDLIYGIQKNAGTGKYELIGINIPDVDKEIQRLESILRDGIQPRILGLNILPIPIEESRCALIVRVGKSFIGPHRVTFRGHDKFYARNTNGKYQMDVSELRLAFNFSESAERKIREFHLDRIAKINANETPVPFIEGAKIVTHLIPISSFYADQNYDLSYFYEHPMELVPVTAPSWQCTYNLEGLFSYFRQEKESTFVYLQLFRNGAIEEVEGGSLRPEDGRKLIFSGTLESELKSAVTRYINILRKLGVEPNLLYYLSFLGIRSYTMAGPHAFEKWPGEVHEIVDDVIDMPEILIETFDIAADQLLKPSFDRLWNACGYPFCPSYGKRTK